MCGRYYNRRQKQQIAEQLRVGSVFDAPYEPNYNVAPTTFQPIVRQSRETDDRELVLARWGLVPFVAKSLADFKGFNLQRPRKGHSDLGNMAWPVQDAALSCAGRRIL